MISPFPRFWFVAQAALAVWLLTITSVSADTYSQWKARVFTTAEQGNPAISDESAIPANDGVTNLEKFAFDLDPHRNGAWGRPTGSTVLDYNYFTGEQEPFLAISYRYPYSYYPENITTCPRYCPICKPTPGCTEKM